MSEGASVAPRVLVADDDEDILELVSRRLQRSGYEVDLARDGQEALALALASPPQVAVLDVMMPGLDGLELTRRLRAHDSTRDVRIVVLTAAVSDADRQASLDAGADLHVKKPFSPRELAAEVDRLAGRTPD